MVGVSWEKIFLFFCFSILIHLGSLAQDKPEPEDNEYKPLLLKLSPDGTKYLRFITWHQIWLVSNNLEADNAKFQLTPSIRRSRILAYAQVSSKFLILTHFGLNSLTPQNLTSLGNNGNGPQLFLHGAWGEFKLTEDIYLGGGLHYWKGLTRLSSQSTLNFMTLDQSRPFISWHSLGITDQFARHLGFYAKGQMGNFDYRLAVNAPLHNNLNEGKDYGLKDSGLSYNGVINTDSEGNTIGNTIVEGYFRYNFWDKESTKLPYQVGTYLGKKKVFGIGVGFFSHPNGMYDGNTGAHSHVNHFAVDAFLDKPIPTGALNVYTSFIKFDYGENYVSRWAGTGKAVYAQIGYYSKRFKLMPYIAFQSGNYDGFDKPVSAADFGLNYFINGHNAKLTLEYHRIKGDVREAEISSQEDALSQIRLQMHIFL